MKSVFEKILDKEQQTIWNFAVKHNVPYGKLLDFIKDNQIKNKGDA